MNPTETYIQFETFNKRDRSTLLYGAEKMFGRPTHEYPEGDEKNGIHLGDHTIRNIIYNTVEGLIYLRIHQEGPITKDHPVTRAGVTLIGGNRAIHEQYEEDVIRNIKGSQRSRHTQERVRSLAEKMRV